MMHGECTLLTKGQKVEKRHARKQKVEKEVKTINTCFENTEVIHYKSKTIFLQTFCSI